MNTAMNTVFLANMNTAATKQKEDDPKTEKGVTRLQIKHRMLLINYEAPDGGKRHKRLWNGGNGRGTVKLYEKKDSGLELVDEVEATHIGYEYGEYDHEEQY